MFVIISYDVSDNSRRNRLFKLLEGHGQPVQRSVFECDLTPAEFRTLRGRVAKIVDAQADLVRFYRMCVECTDRIDWIGGLPVTHDPDYYVV